MNMKAELSCSEVRKIMDYLTDKAVSTGKGIAMAVVDDHGELMAFQRTDGCPPSAVVIAQNKAFTAARDRQESKELWNVAQSMKISGADLGDIRYTTLGGGVPVMHECQVIGAVGVSGMSEEEDRALAREAVALVK